MLFISHSTLDKNGALDLKRYLLLQGYKEQQLFLDSEPEGGIPPGAKWENEIYRNLSLCRAVIVLCSPRWNASKWCFAELATAKMRGKAIFPVVIENCDRRALSEYQALLATQPAEQARAFEWLSAELKKRGMGPSDIAIWPNPDLRDNQGGIDHCPFPGLSAFDERYEAVYFGRERERDDLLEQLQRMRSRGSPRLLMIAGGSGSGKSSLMKAAVLSRLKQRPDWFIFPTLRFAERMAPGALFESLAFHIVTLYPQSTHREGLRHIEYEELCKKLAGANGASEFLLAARSLVAALGKTNPTILLPIDQFEELLAASSFHPHRSISDKPPVSTNGNSAPPALQSPESAADGFLRFLHELCSSADSRALVIGTLRSDYLDVYEQHRHAVRSPHFTTWRLEPFAHEQVERVIAEPANRAGIEISRELIERLKIDTKNSEERTIDALPLLAFTLEKLYRRCSVKGKLEITDYVEIGGLEGAIRQTADRILASNAPHIPIDAAAAVRLCFTKNLVQINDKGEFVRRIARWTDVVADIPLSVAAEAVGVLENFVNARLLTRTIRETGTNGHPVDLAEITLEVTHEAIFRCWPPLQGWLSDSTRILRWRRDVQRDQESAALNKQRWGGLKAEQLALSRDWPKSRPTELTAEEKRWIAKAMRRANVLKAAVTFVILVIVLLGGLAALNLKLRYDERERYYISLAEGNHLQSQLAATGENRDAVAALNLAAKAIAAAPVAYSRNVIFAEHARVTALAAPLQTIRLGTPVSQAALSPNGQIVVLQAPSGALSIWDLRQLIKIPAPQLAQGWSREMPVFSPSGNRVAAVVHVDGNTQLWTWELTEATDVRRIPLRNSWACVQNCQIVFPDEQHLVVTSDTTELGWQLDNYALTGRSEPIHIESGQFYASDVGGRIKLSRINQRDLALITPYTGFHKDLRGARGRKTADTLQAVDISTGQIVYERRLRPFSDAAWIPGTSTVLVTSDPTSTSSNPWSLVDLATGEIRIPRQGGCRSCSIGAVSSRRVLVIADDKLTSVPLDSNSREPLDSRFGFNRTADGTFDLKGSARKNFWLSNEGDLAVAQTASGQVFLRRFDDGLETQLGVGEDAIFASFNERERSLTTVDADGALHVWSLDAPSGLWSQERLFAPEDVAGIDLIDPMFASGRAGWLGQSAAAMLVDNQDHSGSHLLVSKRNATPVIRINLPFSNRPLGSWLYANKNGQQFGVASTRDGFVIISRDGQRHPFTDLDGHIERLAFAGSNDQNIEVALLKTSDKAQQARILRLDLASKKIVGDCAGPSNNFFGGFTSDSRYALYYDDRELTLWSTDTCRPEMVLRNFARYGTGADWGIGIAAALISQSAVSVATDGTLRLDLGGKATWLLRDAGGDVSTLAGKPVAIPKLKGRPLSSSLLLAVDPDGQWLAASRERRRGRSQFAVFDTETGLPVIDFGESFPRVMASILESDGRGYSMLLSDGRLLRASMAGRSEASWIREYSKLSTGLDPSTGTRRELTLTEIPALRVNVCKELAQSRDAVAQAIAGRLASVRICDAEKRAH